MSIFKHYAANIALIRLKLKIIAAVYAANKALNHRMYQGLELTY